ncbi:unnamed protein product [Caenorhabditis brenneri]
MPIPLLRTPSLVVRVLISFLEDYDLLLFAQMSRKTRIMITKSVIMKIRVNIYRGRFAIEFRRPRSANYSNITYGYPSIEGKEATTLHFGGLALPCKRYGNYPVFDCGGQQYKLVEQIVKFFAHSFNLQCEAAMLNSNATDNYHTMQLLKRFGLEIESVGWSGSFEDENTYRGFMDLNCNTKRLELMISYATCANHNFSNFRVQELFVLKTNCINGHDLSKLINCKEVQISPKYDVKLFEDEDLIAFVKKWMETKCELRMLRIKTRVPNWRKLMKGIGGVQKQGKIYKVFKPDGVEAAWYFYRHRYFVFVEKTFLDANKANNMWIDHL